MRTKCDKLPCTFHAHPWFGGSPWYDWAYVEFAKEGSNSDVRKKYDPLLILGFICAFGMLCGLPGNLKNGARTLTGARFSHSGPPFFGPDF